MQAGEGTSGTPLPLQQAESDAGKVSAAPWAIDAAGGVTFTFSSPEQVRDYLVQEREKWSWLPGAGAEPASRLYRELGEALKSGATGAREPNFTLANGDSVKASLKRYLEFEPAIHDRAPLQAYLLDIRNRDAQEAAMTLGWLLRLAGRIKTLEGNQPHAPAFPAGIANAVSWNRGVAAPEPRAEALLDTLARLASEGADMRDRAAASAESARQSLLDAQKASDDLRRATEDLGSAVKERVGQLEQDIRTNAKKLHDELTEKAGKTGQALEEEWKRLTVTYDSKLGLSAPATYWKNKRREHGTRALAFGGSLVALAALGASGLWWLYGHVFGTLQVNQTPTWGQVLPTTITAVLYLWALKTLIRLTMSHVHLGLDAEERRVMIMSYLAISRRSEVSSEERKALFSAIFRSTGDGIVKDETPPIPTLELLRGGK